MYCGAAAAAQELTPTLEAQLKKHLQKRGVAYTRLLAARILVIGSDEKAVDAVLDGLSYPRLPRNRQRMARIGTLRPPCANLPGPADGEASENQQHWGVCIRKLEETMAIHELRGQEGESLYRLPYRLWHVAADLLVCVAASRMHALQRVLRSPPAPPASLQARNYPYTAGLPETIVSAMQSQAPGQVRVVRRVAARTTRGAARGAGGAEQPSAMPAGGHPPKDNPEVALAKKRLREYSFTTEEAEALCDHFMPARVRCDGDEEKALDSLGACEVPERLKKPLRGKPLHRLPPVPVEVGGPPLLNDPSQLH
jgi:hypothetical protein